MGAPVISLEHVGCSYGGPNVIDDVTLRICEGEFVGIVGPSGSGKSTVLKAMLAAIEPVYGRAEVSADVRLGYVPQVEAVDWNFPATVRDVIAMNIERPRFRRLDRTRRASIDVVLERLGLVGLTDRHIGALSGGQQQRVFVARALIREPDLLVLDEPAGGVDVTTRHDMLHLLADLHRDGMTIVLTTHDINGLAAHLPRLVCFNRTVIADGSPRDVLHPYVLERTYGAAMDVLQHGGMPVVLEHRGHPPHRASPTGDDRSA